MINRLREKENLYRSCLVRNLIVIGFILALSFGLAKNVSAAQNIEVLAVNGGGNDFSDVNYLYSETMFVDCISKMNINGQPISRSNIRECTNPTYNQLDNAIAKAFSGNSDSTLSIFYYAGHGTTNSDDGHSGIYTNDRYNYDFSTLYKKLKGYAGKFIVILDCCYSGSFISQNYFDDAARSKFLILTACQSRSYSPDYNKLSGITTLFSGKKVMITYYTDAVLNALGYYNGKLAADSNKDSVVSADELFSYLNKNYKKTYSYKHEGKSGSVYVEPQKLGNIPLSFSYASLKMSKTSASLAVGKTLQLKAVPSGTSGTVEWYSSKDSVAAVSSSGLVNAKAAGEATITASVNGLYAYCDLKVTGTKITVGTPKISKVDTSKQNIVTVSWDKVPGADGYAVYTASSGNGTYKKVKTVGSGTLKVSLKIGNGKSLYIKVRAYKKDNGKNVYGAYSSAKKATDIGAVWYKKILVKTTSASYNVRCQYDQKYKTKRVYQEDFPYYKVVDINKDGIKDLILHSNYRNPYDDNTILLLTYYENKVKPLLCIGGAGARGGFYLSGRNLVVKTGGSDFHYVGYFTISAGKLKVVRQMEHYVDKTSVPYKDLYYVNGKKTTYTKYYPFYQKYNTENMSNIQFAIV